MVDRSYRLVDSGDGRKLERFGPYLLDRLSPQVIWEKKAPELWNQAKDKLVRRGERVGWEKGNLKEGWKIEIEEILFLLKPTDFGHLGIFPEQRPLWASIRDMSRQHGGASFLNLFAYSGGSTLFAALGGATVCHVDASKSMVNWAKENALLNGLDNAPIRWIVDDVTTFLKREIGRGRRYDAIILDPPSFGRGPNAESFKIEEDLVPLLKLCRSLLSPNPLFVLLTCHTPGFTPIILSNLLEQFLGCSKIERGELILEGDEVFPIPSGSFAKGFFV